MKKIPTLFERVYENHKIKDILPNVTPGMEFVLEGDGVATVKFDGSCCAVIARQLYIRYDAKNGKPIPENAIKCQEEPDPVTGHLPCWIPYDPNNPGHKWYKEAYDNTARYFGLISGTYEAIGPHFQGNPYNLERDFIVKHGFYEIEVPRTFEGIRDYLRDHYIEGIVFWRRGEPKCKIKRTDFGFEWNSKEDKK